MRNINELLRDTLSGWVFRLALVGTALGFVPVYILSRIAAEL